MLHQIGVGALGPVFRTYEPTRDRLVAVKVFRLDVTPEQARALADELGRVTEGNLFHPSIVEPVSAGVEGTVAYRAEEYVAAESLDVAMRHYAPATLDKVLPFITQLAAAIDFARQKGVGHGALHPRDIFVTPDEARATGFGVVDALDRLGLRAPVRRPYSPPERIAGERWGTPADVFSLGAIAFELITGRRPSGLGDQIGALTGASLGDRAEAIRAVLVRSMREHPIERYATALEFASDLDRAAGHPIAAQIAALTPSTAEAPAPNTLEESATSKVEEAAASGAEALALSEVERAEIVGAQDETLLSGLPTLEDSPREVARKVIAARKRQSQGKQKAHGRPETDAAAVSLLVPPDPIPMPPSESVETTEATSQFAAESSSPALLQLDPSDEPAPVNAPPAADVPREPIAKDPDLTLARIPGSGPEPEPEPELESEKIEKEDDAPAIAERIPDIEPVGPREREIDVFRAERPWPRAADRHDHLADLSLADLPSARKPDDARRRLEPVEERPFDLAQGRPEPVEGRSPELPIAWSSSESSSERMVMPKPTALEPFDPELPPPLPLRPTAEPPPLEPVRQTAEEAVPADRPRPMLLPTAVGLIIGLLIGFLSGYGLASRDANTQLAQQGANAPSNTQPTGSGGTAPSTAAAPATTTPSPQATPAAQPPTRVDAPAASAQPTTGQPASSKPEDRGATTAAKPAETSRVATKPPNAPAATTPDGGSTRRAEAPPAPSERARATTPPVASREPAGAPSARTGVEGRRPDAAVTSGRIVVSSTPSRAAVTVNGVWSGRTPLTLADRPFGKYVVRVVEPGFTVARQEFTLSASAPTKTIEVTLEPSGGGTRGEKPQATKGTVAPSERTRADGPAPVPPVPVESTAPPTSTRGQTPGTATGSMFVDSRPRGARVIVDGKDYGVTPTTVPGLTLGQHSVRLELDDHGPWTAKVTVTTGTTVRVTGSLERIQ